MEYVSEKLEHALEHMHHVVQSLEEDMAASDTKDRVVFTARAAFQQALVSFLALHNLLALANDPQLPEKLLGLPGDDFEEWLVNNRAEGSVTG